MRYRLAAMLVLLMTVVCAASCGTTASASSLKSGVIPLLTVAAPTGSGTLDPDRSQGCNMLFCGLMLEHLLDFGPGGKLEPELATSWSQTGPVTYVYHLRHGVRFWDGNPMTSADVVYSINYDRQPRALVQFALGGIQSVTASGPYTVTVTLSQPDPSFKYSLSYEGPIFEKSFQESHQDTLGNPGTLIQGTGPWEPDSFDPTTGIDMSANPHWWGGKVPVKDISFKFYSTETGEALAMRAGEVDVAFPQGGRSFAATSGGKVISYPFDNLGYFTMNVKIAPWNDVHVRRAVAYALNRSAIIDADGGRNAATPVYSDLPPMELDTLGTPSQVNKLINSLPQYRFNLTKARQEMAESGYPEGFTATLDVDNYGDFPEMAQVIAADLQKIGINLKLTVMSDNQWGSVVDGPKTYGPGFTTLYSVAPDPSIRANYLFGSQSGQPVAYNMANDVSPAIDQLLSAGVSSPDPAKRLALYDQLLKQSANNVPYVPLFIENSFTATSSQYVMPPDSIWQGFIPWALEIKRS
jgi:peptide/nickel transport system substrate-binding protein